MLTKSIVEQLSQHGQVEHIKDERYSKYSILWRSYFQNTNMEKEPVTKKNQKKSIESFFILALNILKKYLHQIPKN
jgi:hypothetical protein